MTKFRSMGDFHVNIYDLKNYDYKQYDYTKGSIRARRIIRTLDISTRIISILLIMYFLLCFAITTLLNKVPSWLYWLVVAAVMIRVIGVITYFLIDKSLLKKNKEDYHDLQYYFFCKRKRKLTNNMRLLNMAKVDIEMSRYKDAINALEVMESKFKDMRSNKIIILYLYVRCYKALGEEEKFKETLDILNDEKNKVKLTKEEVLIIETINKEK